MKKIQVSKKAQEDLGTIWEYTLERWSVEQADLYYKILIDAINLIGREPNLGKNYNEIREGYFGFQIKSHIIFYRYNNKNGLEIIRILHQRMDLLNRL